MTFREDVTGGGYLDWAWSVPASHEYRRSKSFFSSHTPHSFLFSLQHEGYVSVEQDQMDPARSLEVQYWLLTV
jgi:hypothetical protein